MKNYLACLLLLCTFSLTTAFGQARLGIKGGVTFANVNYDVPGAEFETDMKTTFHIGPILEVGVTPTIGVNAALLYAGRGYKGEFDVFGVTGEFENSVYYLQVPINLVYDADIFYFSGGPYFGFALSGKTTSGDDEVDVDFGSSDEDDLSSSDFGFNVELGVNLDRLRLGVGYGLGLSNNFPGDFKDNNDDISIKNNAINVSATYFFGAQ